MQQLYHANVRTMSSELPLCSGILVRDGIIRQTGDFAVMRALYPDAKVQDYGNATLLPGFIDGHSHLSAVAYGLLLWNAKPSPSGNCDSLQAIIHSGQEYLQTHSLAPGQWLLGLGYDNAMLPGEKHPTRWDLDQITTERPIALTHVSGHLCVVNTRAMELLGYSQPDCVVPEGGIVEPSGLLKETAFTAPEKARLMQGPTPDQVLQGVAEAARLYASYGFTTIQDGRTTPADHELLTAAGKAGLIGGDVACYLAPDAAERWLPKQWPALNPYQDHCRMAGAKLYLDGSPQGKTAWLSEPYHVPPNGEAPGYRGFGVQSDQEVTDFFSKCLRNHWQANVHANGDAAIEQLICCYEQAMARTGSTEALRPVIIHAQTVRRDQLARMARLGMLASFFHDHVYYWGDYHTESVLGPQRAQNISPLGWAKDAGISYTLHQDSPVVPPNALLSMQTAVLRRTCGGKLLGGEHRASVEDALCAFTTNAAYQIFEEAQKGSIAPGKLADFTVLSSNPFTVPPERIGEITVLTTIKQGESIYNA